MNVKEKELPKCPKCRKEIDYLIEFQKELTAIPVTLDSRGELEYESYRDLEPEPLEPAYWACPECLETLFESEKKAIAFLKGIK